MSRTAAAVSTEVIDRLRLVCSIRGPQLLTARLRDLQEWIADDLMTVEAELEGLPRAGSLVHRSAAHLLDLGGKHLRPMCVALASRLGSGFGQEARDFAVAVELIHNATLLHDDVIDLGERRRGGPTPRMVYGDTVSVLAGDWLLVSALERIQRANLPGVLERTLATLQELIAAEAIQLENRGRINPERSDYFRVVDGKTASLFRCAMFCGAKAGGLEDDAIATLERYATHLGLSFQLVDDVLDFGGDSVMTGKSLFSDLREGKMSYPLLVAMDRSAPLGSLVESLLERPAGDPSNEPLVKRVAEELARTGGIRDSMALARESADDAIACLDELPEGRGREALLTLAEATVSRRR